MTETGSKMGGYQGKEQQATNGGAAAADGGSAAAAEQYFPSHIVYDTPETWRPQLDALPSLEALGGKIPSIYLAHGNPMMLPNLDEPDDDENSMSAMGVDQSPNGKLNKFLADLGPVLMAKYKPRAIVVISAHWEASGNQILVSDYTPPSNPTAENPLLMDYFGFASYFYRLKFHSVGDHALSEQIVSLLKNAKKNFSTGGGGIPARTTTVLEPRGRDGRGGQGPGLDHGVFMPFKLMFGDTAPVPIVQVSMDGSLDPRREWELGAALESLRSEGILIISGGLTIHTFRDFMAFNRDAAKPIYKEFDKAVLEAATTSPTAPVPDTKEGDNARKRALLNLVKHRGFRPSHHRDEHFVPLYIAAGAASGEEVEDKSEHQGTLILSGLHGAKTIAFGV